MLKNRSEHARFGDYLVDTGTATARQLREALDFQRASGHTLGSSLLALGILNEADLLRSLGRYHEAPTVSAKELRDIPSGVLRLVPEELVHRYAILPFRLLGNTICIASNRPGDIAIENEVALATSRLTRTFLGLDLRIQEALQRFYGIEATPAINELAQRLDSGLAGRPPAAPDEGPIKLIGGARTGSPGTGGQDAETPPFAETVGRPINWERFEGTTRRRLNELLEADDDETLRSVVEEAPLSEIQLSDADLQPVVEHRATHDDGVPESTAAAPDAPTVRPVPSMSFERDRIADYLLRQASDFRRRLVLAYRSNRVLGWKGDGAGIVPRFLSAVNFSIEDSAPFLSVANGAEFWLGPLVPAPGSEQIVRVLGGRQPTSCMLLPIRVGDRIAAFLYLDNIDAGVTGAPISELLELAGEAGSALQKLIQSARERERAVVATQGRAHS